MRFQPPSTGRRVGRDPRSFLTGYLAYQRGHPSHTLTDYYLLSVGARDVRPDVGGDFYRRLAAVDASVGGRSWAVGGPDDYAREVRAAFERQFSGASSVRAPVQGLASVAVDLRRVVAASRAQRFLVAVSRTGSEGDPNLWEVRTLEKLAERHSGGLVDKVPNARGKWFFYFLSGQQAEGFVEDAEEVLGRERASKYVQFPSPGGDNLVELWKKPRAAALF